MSRGSATPDPRFWLRAALAAAGAAAVAATVLAVPYGAAAGIVAAVAVPVAWLSLARAVQLKRRLAHTGELLTGERARADERDAELARVRSEAEGTGEQVVRERSLRDAVQAAFETVAGNVHAMATVQSQVLDGIEKRISDPELLADVMRADHAAAQMTRKAQTLLVMCGVWPARRERQPVSLYDCVRGAQSRIVEFGRVEVHGGQAVAVAAPMAEGVMHALAELLENATVFSPSTASVVVSVRDVATGAVVEIDDAGLGMPADVLDLAVERLREGLDLTALGAVPRLGLACVGRWARELGFSVELSSASAYGGTRVVVFLPHRLLAEPPAERPEQPVRGPRLVEPDFGTIAGGDVAGNPVEMPGGGGPAGPGPRGPAGPVPAGPVGPVPAQPMPAEPMPAEPPAAGPPVVEPLPVDPLPAEPPAAEPLPADRFGADPLSAAPPPTADPLSAAPPPNAAPAPPADTQPPAPPSTQRPAGAPGALPQRRSRRRHRAPHRVRSATEGWTPDDARAAIDQVLAGTRRGRVQAADLAEPGPADDSIPPGSAPPGSAPPGSAPPGSAPPGSAPPGSAPPNPIPPGSGPRHRAPGPAHPHAAPPGQDVPPGQGHTHEGGHP